MSDDSPLADVSDGHSLPEPVRGTVSFSTLEEHGLLPALEDRLQPLPASVDPATAGLTDANAETLGTVIHETLDRASGLGLSAAEWRTQAETVATSLGAPARVGIRAGDLLATLGPRIDELGTVVGTEVPFSFRCNGWLVIGHIDAIVEGQHDDVRVVDFKTGTVTNAHPFQLQLYVLACARDVDRRAQLVSQPTGGVCVPRIGWRDRTP